MKRPTPAERVVGWASETAALLSAMAEVDRLSDPYLHLAHSDVSLEKCGCECVNGALCHCDDGGCECEPEKWLREGKR